MLHTERLLNYTEAASILGVQKRIIRGLVTRGLLAANPGHRCGSSKLLLARDVQNFKEQYVDLAVVAERFSTSVKWVVSCLKDASIPIFVVPQARNAQKRFVLQQVATRVRIPPKNWYRRKKQRFPALVR